MEDPAASSSPAVPTPAVPGSPDIASDNPSDNPSATASVTAADNPSAIPAGQPFVPVITGGDVGAYSLAREFHEAYGVISAVVPTSLNRNLKHSAILEAFPAGPMTEEQPVIDALVRVAERLRGKPRRPLLLLASYDHLVRFAVRHREALEAAGYTVPYPDEDALDAAALKENFYALCERYGVPYPKTATYDAGSHTPEAARQFAAGLGLTYPVILKAGDGGAWADIRFEGRRKVHIIDGAAEVEALLGKASAAGYRGAVIVQEMVPGPDSQLGIATFFRDRSGSTRLVSYGEVIVEDHAPGLEGNARAVLASEHPAIADQGITLMEALDWHGFAMFDTKIDPRTGVAQFLEMNPRLGRNHYYLTASGANPAPYLVEEYLNLDLKTNSRLDEGRVTTTGPALITTIPLSLVNQYATAAQRQRIRQAKRAGRAVRPFSYSADRDLRRELYLRAAEVKARRVFRNHPAPRA
ncbi:carbamoyl-phosphate synthase [Citricoccus sp.]|uniref:carboxylate--amine ligase n=1 Tax=Citricoccus sp. TaxID=1978372 RepID=UPI0028BE277F|nr:carbamoyl-phosphate synthase [Citricoccus sp.]